MGYQKTAIRGFSILTVTKVVTKIAALGKMMIIARILTPDDVGVVGLATIILSLSEVATETGIAPFLIHTKQPIEKYLSSAWVVSIVRGVVLCAVLLLLAPLLSSFYRSPVLFSLIFVAAFIPLVKGFINPSIILFQKELAFHKEAFLRSGLFFVEVIVSIILVAIFANPLSLIASLLITAFLEVILTHMIATPRPHWKLQRSSITEFFAFGKWVNVTNIVGYLAQNADDLLIGRLLGTTSLGYYQAAFNIGQSTLGEVGELGAQTVFPIYSRIHTERQRLADAMRKSVIATSSILAIPLIITIVGARWFVLLILGPQWEPSIGLLQILAVGAYLQGINAVIFPVFLATGKPQWNAMTLSVYLFCMFILIIIGSHFWGIYGAALAIVISRLCIQPIIALQLKRSVFIQ